MNPFLTHPESAAILAEMVANPGQAEPALKLADWAEANGLPAHAEMIRLHHSPEAAIPRQNPTHADWLYDRDPGGNRYKAVSITAGSHTIRHEYADSGRNFRNPKPTGIVNMWMPLEPGFGFTKGGIESAHFKAKLDPKAAEQLTRALKQESKIRFGN